VTYKIGGELSGMLDLAVAAAPIMAAIYSLHSCLAGLLLILVFVDLFQLLVSALGSMLGIHDTKAPVQPAVLISMLSAAAALAWLFVGRVSADPVAFYRHASQTLVWRVALAPLRGFFEVITAQRVWPDQVLWGALCLVIDAALLAAVYALDAR